MRGAVQLATDFAIFEGIHFRDNPRGPASLVVLDFPVNHCKEARLHVDRSDQQLVIVALERAAGEVVKELDRVMRNAGIAGE